MKRTTPLATILLTLGALTGPLATAQENDRLVYDLRGEDDKRGRFTTRLTVETFPGVGIEVVRATRYKDDTTHTQRGVGKQVGPEVHVTLRDVVGVSDRISPTGLSPETKLKIRVRSSGEIRTRGTSAAGESKAEGRLLGKAEDVAGTASESAAEEKPEGWAEKLAEKGKHLIAVANREVRKRIRKEGEKLVYDGVELESTFKLSDYFHVGVAGEVEGLRESELSPEQVLTLKDSPRSIWLRSHVEGGVRVPLSTTIPVGEFNVGLGLDSAAKVNYEVTDLYAIPEGITDGSTIASQLKLIGKRSFDLPLDAAEARKLKVGAARAFEGNASVAVSGNLSIGHEVSKIRGVARVGASTRVGGFYRIQGNMRIEVTRLARSEVRLRLTRGQSKSRGVSADLLLGATVDEADAKKEVAPLVEYIDEALVDLDKIPSSLRDKLVEEAEDQAVDALRKTVRKVLRFRIDAEATRTQSDELDLAFRFDLNVAAAREAYERAVRGDYTLAERRSLEPDAGVVRDYRVVEVEDVTHRAIGLQLSVILKAGASKEIRTTDLSVHDESGQTDYEVFRFTRRFDLELFSHERHKRVDVEVLRRTREGATVPSERVQRSLRVRIDLVDPITRKSEASRLQRLMQAWSLDSDSGLETPGFRLLRSRYGNTRTKIDVGISEEGIEQALAKGEDAMFQAYVRAFAVITDKQPLWATAAGRARVRSSRTGSKRHQLQRQRQELRRARDFVEHLSALGAAKTARERADAMKQIASDARYDYYAVAALVELAPRSAVNIDASILGKRIRVVDGHRGGAYGSVSVADPR